jgi:hypothetical protein
LSTFLTRLRKLFRRETIQGGNYSRKYGIYYSKTKIISSNIGVKELPDENQSDNSDSEVDEKEHYPKANEIKPYQYGQFPELNHNDLYEEPAPALAPAIKKPTKPECPYDLNGISRDDLIEFFKEDEGLKVS